MSGINILIHEHRHILQVTEKIISITVNAMVSQAIDLSFYQNMVQWARNYADIYHHQKEETILFIEMEREIGDLATTLIQHGMLVEHNLARFYIYEIERALDAYEAEKSDLGFLTICSYATAYAFLLQNHINKEDNTLFPFARKHLSAKTMEAINMEIEKQTDMAIETTYTDLSFFIQSHSI